MVEVLQSEMQKRMADQPSRLEVLREYEKRGALNRKYKDELWNLEAGELGEKLVLKYLNDYGEAHWKVLRNVWLEYHTTFECDMVLLTGVGPFAIEIKHYTGDYELKNSQWSCNGVKRAHNPVGQTQRVMINLHNITSEQNLPATIKGALIFTGPHFTLDVQDPLEDLDILTANQLRNFIYEIAREERKSWKKFNQEAFLSVINKYETTNPFPAENLYEELGSNLRKGIMCCHCGSFEVNLGKNNVSCDCGMSEPVEMTIIRTICEYGVIHFYKDLQTKDLLNFFDGAYSKTTLVKYLNTHFEKYGSGRNTRYRKISRPFLKIIDRFGFKKDCKITCKNLSVFMETNKILKNYMKNLL